MIRVLVVDDSVVFRTQISAALTRNPEIQVVAIAASGSIALQRLAQHSVDVVTLDMEMPDMNGIEVLREIRRLKFPVKVIVFSSQTQRGAEAALLALREGADDVVAKPSGEGLDATRAAQAIQDSLNPKVLQFRPAAEPTSVSKPPARSTPGESPRVSSAIVQRQNLATLLPSVLVIGSSTGGPTALESIFSLLKGPVALPILLVQHMPPVFTEILAKRLEAVSGIPAGEAKSGEKIIKNRIYVAPGDYHMIVDRGPDGPRLLLNQDPQRNSVRPAVDSLFESAAATFGKGCLGVVLTGMGEDGLVGARAIRKVGGGIMIQNRESCVVFGMPGAIYQADEYDEMGNLEVIAGRLKTHL